MEPHVIQGGSSTDRAADTAAQIGRGAVLALMVVALLIANVGLDEVFNPKLRES